MEVTVRESGNGKFTQDIIVGKHVLTADEPVAGGGMDTGLSPYDFLLAALGSCTSMTLRMYADLKKIPLKETIVKLTYEKIHATDCVNCDSNDARVDHIDRKIELLGEELTQDQRAKLLEIANKCPVHRTLSSKILITSELVE